MISNPYFMIEDGDTGQCVSLHLWHSLLKSVWSFVGHDDKKDFRPDHSCTLPKINGARTNRVDRYTSTKMCLCCPSELFSAALVVRITRVMIHCQGPPALIIGSRACLVSVSFWSRLWFETPSTSSPEGGQTMHRITFVRVRCHHVCTDPKLIWRIFISWYPRDPKSFPHAGQTLVFLLDHIVIFFVLFFFFLSFLSNVALGVHPQFPSNANVPLRVAAYRISKPFPTEMCLWYHARILVYHHSKEDAAVNQL